MQGSPYKVFSLGLSAGTIAGIIKGMIRVNKLGFLP